MSNYIMKSKLYSNEEVDQMRKNISVREGIPEKWLYFNLNTEKHFGTIIPAYLINKKEIGNYINHTAFEL